MTVATVVDIYMQSPNCSAAKKAVDAAFGGGSGHIFKRGINGVCEVKGTFRKKLVQIALDNRMCRSIPLVSESYLYWIINEGIGYHTCGYCAGYGVVDV